MEHQMVVRLRGVELGEVDEAKGTIEVLIECAPLTSLQREVMEQLFPVTYLEAEKLLQKELLLQRVW